MIVNHLINNNAYESGKTEDFNKDYAIDINRLFKFLKDTQPKIFNDLYLDNDKKNFLDELKYKISNEGIIKLFHNGFKYKDKIIELYQPQASEGNVTAAKLYSQNIFSVINQVYYSKQNNNSVDIVIFLNGLPIITMELKHPNRATVDEAVEQYKKTRSPAELLFGKGRCIVHFAVDDSDVKMCTILKGDKSEFMPFNKGDNDGAGNPINLNGAKTAYLWEEILTKTSLSNIIENYIQSTSTSQIFPRYHQWRVVENLTDMAKTDGVGHRYLIQHSAGSGKSNSIAWLTKKLVDLNVSGKKIFDSVLIVTDRINLDSQIGKTINKFVQVKAAIAKINHSSDLRKALDNKKAIIVTTVQKFLRIFNDDIRNSYKNLSFAIIIDEAHSGQGGKTMRKVNCTIGGETTNTDDDVEDQINARVAGSAMAKNASYFAFTATPKNKTLEMFGQPTEELDEDGKRKFLPHDLYSMKQAIEEHFILDVLKNYTTYKSYCNLIKAVEDDPLFYKNQAVNFLYNYVNKSPEAISEKSKIIVDHFLNNVQMKINGKARAMVVTEGIAQAVNYYDEIDKLLKMRSNYRAIVAFTGTVNRNGKECTEVNINGFSDIEKRIRTDPYRILIVADKFQTGYDEPLLQTMYVDKQLRDVRAVQTLSRLNRIMSGKNEVFILDFANDIADIQTAFNRYYKTTILSGETDIKKLHSLVNKLKSMNIFNDVEVDEVLKILLGKNNNDNLNAIYTILDTCAERFNFLDDRSKIEFKNLVQAFLKSYYYISCIISCNFDTEFEKLAIFLDVLKNKLHVDNKVNDITELKKSVILKTYRVVKHREKATVTLQDENTEIKANNIPTKFEPPTPKLDTLSNILELFREKWAAQFGEEKITKMANDTKDIIAVVAIDRKYMNAKKYSDEQNSKIESDQLIKNMILDKEELFDAFQNNRTFKNWVMNLVFQRTYYDDSASTTILEH